uniref:MYND-type domain-containing protein n=1 Tax=Anopheles funestus TaxID=62324 RepID=A0A4Y0BGH1_ANOFN
MFRAYDIGETESERKKMLDELLENIFQHCITAEGMDELTNDQFLTIITRKMEPFIHDLMLFLSTDVKDKAQAIAFRAKGNEYFHPTSKEGLGKALIYYNLSIAYAEKGSEERAIAYTNRSMVCLQYERYEECLVNIRLARESNCPERLMEKLNRREAAALDGLLKPHTDTGIEREDVDELKLSYNSHKNVPQMVECLELHRNEEFGRHMVTTRKLKAGDILMIEKPFATMLNDDAKLTRCAHCHDIKPLILIPCEGCTMAMYCSEECLSKAHGQYHRYECAMLKDLWRICGNKDMGGMAGIRTVATAIALFDHDLDEMKDHLNGLDESKVNAFMMDWRTATPKDMYDTVHVLSTNQALRSRKEQAMQIFFATIIHQLMLERTELGEICATNAENRKLLFDLILRHWQISQVNSIVIEEVQLVEDKLEAYRYKYACLSLISMLNHSCVPNVTHIPLYDGRCAVMAVRPIAAGEQLFDCYSFIANDLCKSDRLIHLKKHYQFTCRCGGCALEVEDGDYELDEYMKFMRCIRNLDSISDAISSVISHLNAAERRFLSYKLIEPQLRLPIYVGLQQSAITIALTESKTKSHHHKP